jgi:hypothetical protein
MKATWRCETCGKSGSVFLTGQPRAQEKEEVILELFTEYLIPDHRRISADCLGDPALVDVVPAGN